MLPRSIQERIETLLNRAKSKSEIIEAREHLTRRYKNEKISRGFKSYEEALAYIAARLPATFSVIETVLSYVPLNKVISILDLGAGPGTASLAAALKWPECKNYRLVEENPWMHEISQQLLQGAPINTSLYPRKVVDPLEPMDSRFRGNRESRVFHGALYNSPERQDIDYSFENCNIITYETALTHEVVFLSYVLNELSIQKQMIILKKAWNWTSKALVIIVPGTPTDYKNLMVLRETLIAAGAFIAAPCPHHKTCPLESDDWCHFSTRLVRPSFHRLIKNVALPYEDEKYSYIVAIRECVPRAKSRIIRKPIQRSGHVALDLCTSDGLMRKVVSRKEKDIYKKATKVSWGDGWDDL